MFNWKDQPWHSHSTLLYIPFDQGLAWQLSRSWKLWLLQPVNITAETSRRKAMNDWFTPMQYCTTCTAGTDSSVWIQLPKSSTPRVPSCELFSVPVMVKSGFCQDLPGQESLSENIFTKGWVAWCLNAASEQNMRNIYVLWNRQKIHKALNTLNTCTCSHILLHRLKKGNTDMGNLLSLADKLRDFFIACHSRGSSGVMDMCNKSKQLHSI